MSARTASRSRSPRVNYRSQLRAATATGAAAVTAAGGGEQQQPQQQPQQQQQPQPEQRIFDRMLLQLEKFKCLDTLVADTYWALQRFPDMEMTTLLLAIESADTNNLGLSRVFDALRPRGTASPETLLRAVSDLARRQVDSLVLWQSLLRRSSEEEDASLAQKWTHVNETVTRLFPDAFQTNPEMRNMLSFFAWLNRLSPEQLRLCVELLDACTPADCSPAALRQVKDQLMRLCPPCATVAPVARTATPTPDTPPEPQPLTPSTQQPPVQLQQQQQQQQPPVHVQVHTPVVLERNPAVERNADERRRAVHIFPATARGQDGLIGYAVVWKDHANLQFSGATSSVNKMWLAEAEAVARALRTTQKEFPDAGSARIFVHMLPAAAKALRSRLEEEPSSQDANAVRKIRDFCDCMHVTFKDCDLSRETRDWRFPFAERAHSLASDNLADDS